MTPQRLIRRSLHMKANMASSNLYVLYDLDLSDDEPVLPNFLENPIDLIEGWGLTARCDEPNGYQKGVIFNGPSTQHEEAQKIISDWYESLCISGYIVEFQVL